MANITDTKEFDIRYSYRGDWGFLYRLLSNEEIAKWLPINVSVGAKLFTNNWIEQTSKLCSLTCLYDNQPCAMGILFLMPYKKVKHMAMGYMAVDPPMQMNGIGSSLLKNLIHLSQTKFHLESLHFELFENCPLIPLLEKEGFKEIIRQEKYVIEGNTTLARLVYERWFNEQ